MNCLTLIQSRFSFFTGLIKTVEDIRTRKEGQTFDCKSIQIEPKAFAVPIVAMANADGKRVWHADGNRTGTRRILGNHRIINL